MFVQFNSDSTKFRFQFRFQPYHIIVNTPQFLKIKGKLFWSRFAHYWLESIDSNSTGSQFNSKSFDSIPIPIPSCNLVFNSIPIPIPPSLKIIEIRFRFQFKFRNRKCTSLVIYIGHYSLGHQFRTIKWDFCLASLEEICKLWKWWTIYSGVLQLTDFFILHHVQS